MTRQALIRVLLSLLLLVSQQMATMHVLSHLSAKASGTMPTVSLFSQDGVDSEAELSSAMALDQSCNQCLAVAQLASPVGTASFVLALPAAGVTDAGPLDLPGAGSQTILAFQSRGPPQA